MASDEPDDFVVPSTDIATVRKQNIRRIAAHTQRKINALGEIIEQNFKDLALAVQLQDKMRTITEGHLDEILSGLLLAAQGQYRYEDGVDKTGAARIYTARPDPKAADILLKNLGVSLPDTANIISKVARAVQTVNDMELGLTESKIEQAKVFKLKTEKELELVDKVLISESEFQGKFMRFASEVIAHLDRLQYEVHMKEHMACEADFDQWKAGNGEYFGRIAGDIVGEEPPIDTVYSDEEETDDE